MLNSILEGDDVADIRKENRNGRGGVRLRYYIDPENELPHIYRHDISESEVEEILLRPEEDRPGREGSRIAMGRTPQGRYLRVVYVPDPAPSSLFVITAYELRGKPLAAYRRRRRRKRK